jgi:Tfp pilus assembly protein FimT
MFSLAPTTSSAPGRRGGSVHRRRNRSVAFAAAAFGRARGSGTGVGRSLRAGLTLAEQVIVILVMGVIIAIFIPVISEFTFFQSSEDQAGNLARHLSASRNTAIKANRLVYFEFNLDEDKYSAYTYDRESSELKKEPLIDETPIRLAAIASANGTKITKGVITLTLQPSGVAEELAIYLGEDEHTIHATLLFSRYTGEARVEPGEVNQELQKPEWRHTPG